MRLLRENQNDDLKNFLEALFGRDLPNRAFNGQTNQNTIDRIKNLCGCDNTIASDLYTLIYRSIIDPTTPPVIRKSAYTQLYNDLRRCSDDVKGAFINLCKRGQQEYSNIPFKFQYNGVQAIVFPGKQYDGKSPYEMVIQNEGQAGRLIFMNPRSRFGNVFTGHTQYEPFNRFTSILTSRSFPKGNAIFFNIDDSLVAIVLYSQNEEATVLVYPDGKLQSPGNYSNSQAYSLLNYLAMTPGKSDITKNQTNITGNYAWSYFTQNPSNARYITSIYNLLNTIHNCPHFCHAVKAPFTSTGSGNEIENGDKYDIYIKNGRTYTWKYNIQGDTNNYLTGLKILEDFIDNTLKAVNPTFIGFGIIDNDAPDFVQKDLRSATDFSRNKTQNDSAADNALGTANLSQHINGNGTINRNAESAYERRYKQQMRLFEDKRVLDDFIVQAKDADGKDIIIPKNLDAINENDIYKLVDVIYQWFGKPSSNPWFSKLMSEEKDFVDLLCAAIGTTREDCEDYVETAGHKIDDSLFNGKSKDADGHRQLKKSLFEVYPSLRSKKPDEKAYSMLISMYPKIFLNKFWALISHWKSLTGEETKQLISRTESFDLTDMLHNFILDKCLHAMILDGIPGTRANQINGEPRHYICSCEAVLTCYFADAQDAKFKSTNPDRDVNLRDMFTARLKQNLATFKNDNILDLLNPDNISGLNDKETAELFFRGSLSLDDAGNGGDDDRALGDKLGDLLAKGKTLGGGSTVDQSAALIDFENAWHGIAMDDSLNDLNILDKKAGKMISNRTALCAILKMLEKPYDKEKDANDIVATYVFKHSKDFTKLLSELLQVHGIVAEFALGFNHFGANELCRMLRSGRQLSDDELADDEEKSRKNRLLSKWKKIKADDMILDENLDESKPDIFFLKAYLYSKDEYVKGEKNAFALDEEIKDYGSKKVQAFLRTDEFKDFLKELLDAYDLTKSDLNELLELYTPIELFDMIDH